MTKFSLSNKSCKLGGFDKFTLKKHLTHEIYQRRFSHVKGALHWGIHL